MSVLRITDGPIDAVACYRELRNHACGACVTFEGWVRNHQDGREVRSLEYEVYRPLAISEGERIITEVRQQFPVEEVLCVHREGHLALGDLAVWVGVSSAHRDEAFQAARLIIDQVKVRLPIWKKEHYVDGDSGWVNCERCAAHGHAHS